MKRKSLLIVVIVVLFQALAPSFIYAKTNDGEINQPKVCSWPSEMMSNYFNFQYEAISILLWSKVNERALTVSLSDRGLFSQKVLSLSAIDLVASSVASKAISSFSNLLTSAVLILLVSASVVQSNIGWLAILYQDRPVVRDYKEMLDIETQLFDVAYFRSKQINLTRPLEWDMSTKLKELIKKYQEKWLLDKGKVLEDGSSMADVILDFLSMNAVMKHFVTFGGTGTLSDYNWCIWSFGKDSCNKNTAVLKFSQSAVDQLDKDYEAVRSFSACNSYANFFRNSIGETIDSNKESVKTSVQDVKDSMNRLWWTLVGDRRWNFKNNRNSICEWMSDYEMAQLRAYWWPNRKCWERFNASLDVADISSVFSEIDSYSKEKIAQREQKDKMDLAITSENGSFSKLWSWTTAKDKKQQWYDMYGSGTEYSPNFSMELNSKFEDIFNETMDWYWQSLQSAISSDTSSLFPKGKWILDQVDKTMSGTNNLKDVLQKIVDKQCSG